MAAMRDAGGVREEDLALEIGGLATIMVVDMNVRWGVGLAMLKKDLMAGTWVALLVDIKVVLRIGTLDEVVMVMRLTLVVPREKA